MQPSIVERQDLEQTERLQSLGLLASSIVHDFNNLLTVILGHASLCSALVPPRSALAESLAQINTASERAAGLCSQILAYAGKGAIAAKPMELNHCVQETVELLRVSVGKTTRLTVDLEHGLPPVLVGHSQMQQVVMNLVLNAVEALEGRQGSVTVRTRFERFDQAAIAQLRPPVELTPGHYIVMEVVDTGRGMTPEILDRVFDPFFTTKSTGRGLGLSAVRGILKAHDAHLSVASEPGGGTTFRVLLKPCVAAFKWPAAVSSSSVTWRDSGRVLLVESDEDARATEAVMLEHLGFEVTRTRDGEEAILALERSPGAYRLVVSDCGSAGASASEAIARIRRRDGSIPMLLLCACGKPASPAERSPPRDVAFLHKPLSLDALARSLVPLLETQSVHRHA